MGVNTSVFVLKKEDLNVSPVEYLQQCDIEYRQVDFRFVFGELYKRKTEALIAFSQTDRFWIVVDNNHTIEDELINYSREKQTELLQAENSDTTGTCNFSFYRCGVLVRRLTLGAEQWIDDLKELELDHATETQVIEAMKEVGEKLDFEREGSDAFSVLRVYAIDYDDFDNLKWDIYKVA